MRMDWQTRVSTWQLRSVMLSQRGNWPILSSQDFRQRLYNRYSCSQSSARPYPIEYLKHRYGRAFVTMIHASQLGAMSVASNSSSTEHVCSLSSFRLQNNLEEVNDSVRFRRKVSAQSKIRGAFCMWCSGIHYCN